MGGAQIAEIDGAAWNVSLERSGRRRCHLAGEPGAARPDGDAAERLGTHPLRRRLGRGAARQRCDGPLRPFRSADQSAPVLARIPLHLAAGFVPAAAPAATVRLLLSSPLHPPRVVKGRHRCNPLRSTAKVAAPVPVAKHQKLMNGRLTRRSTDCTLIVSPLNDWRSSAEIERTCLMEWRGWVSTFR